MKSKYIAAASLCGIISILAGTLVQSWWYAFTGDKLIPFEQSGAAAVTAFSSCVVLFFVFLIANEGR